MLSDCDVALNLNNKYVKALDRRAKALRKQAQKIENFEIQVRGLFTLFKKDNDNSGEKSLLVPKVNKREDSPHVDQYNPII